MKGWSISSQKRLPYALVFGMLGCLATALPASAANYWRAYNGVSGPGAYFPDPISACEATFDYWYRANYPDHELVEANERYDFSGILASMECVWHDMGDSSIYPIRWSYAALDCPPGTIPVPNEPWCLSPPPIDSCSPSRGNPISVFSGEKIQRERDFSTADGRLYFERTYTSGGISRGQLGRRWRTNFDRNLIKPHDTGVAILDLGDGRVARFFNTGNSTSPVFHPALPLLSWGSWNGGWTASSTSYRKDQSWSFAKSGTNWIFTDEDGTVEVYDASFRVTSITFQGGYSWTYAYDTNGRNTSVTDSLGRTVTFVYRETGVLESATAPDGSVWRFEYADPYLGSVPATSYMESAYTILTKVILPDGTPSATDNPSRTYHYEDSLSASLLTGITDERGVRTRTWDYDADGRGILSERHGGIDDYAFSFNSSSTVVTNPFGRQETFTRSVNSQGLSRLTQIAGSATSNVAASTEGYQYDGNGYLSQVTDAEGRVTTFVRNARGLETSRTEGSGMPDARTVTTSWHATYRVPTQIVEPGLTTSASYDAAGNLTQLTLTDTTAHTVPYSTNGQTRTWTYTYTASGLLDTIDGPLSGTGDVIDLDYDAQGHLAAITDEVGQTTTVTSVDGAGRPLAVVDPNGVVTAYAYTPRGWLASITVQPGAGQRQTAFEYDAAGHVVEVTLPAGGTLSYTWDNAGRVTRIEDSFGQSMTLAYDEMDRVTQRSTFTSAAALRSTVSRTYDEIGRLLSTIGAASQTEIRAYDRTGNLTQVTDPRGEAWSTAYDAIQRMISATDPELHSVQYGYDGRDNLVRQTDGRGLETTFVRNGFGEPVSETSPDRGTTVYVYDAAGRVTGMTDAEGVVTLFTYDDAGRLTSKTFPSSPALDQTFTYDDTANGNYGAGRLTGATDAFGTRTFAYNAFGDLVRETRTINGHSSTTEYQTSGGGEVTQITYPSGRQVRYLRDALDRVTAVDTREASSAAWTSLAANVTWRPFGPLESLDYGNGLGLDLAYDQNDWLTGIDVAGAGTTVLDLAFTRDAAGAVTAIADAVAASRSAGFTYTDAGRLSSATGFWGSLSWLYDAAGNRTRETRVSGSTTTQLDFTYPAASNRLSEIRDGSGTLLRELLYRLNGQVDEDDRGVSGVWTYGYDADGRLTEARLGGALVAAYGYDGGGRRITRAVTGSPGTSREYLYLPDGRLLAEADGTGAIVREYVWLDGLPLAAVDVSGAGSTLYYIHAGHRGEPLAMTDASRATVWDAAYEPFGAATVFTATTALDLRLPGQQLQAETGLHQNWMRDYDPALGLYLQPDPIGLAGGPNVYSYTGQDPMNYVDPEGTWAWFVVGVLVGGGAELVGQMNDDREGINWGRVGAAAAFGAVGGGLGSHIAKAALSTGARIGLSAYLNGQLGAMQGMLDLLLDPCLAENGGAHILSSALGGAVGGAFGMRVGQGPLREMGEWAGEAIGGTFGELADSFVGGAMTMRLANRPCGCQ